MMNESTLIIGNGFDLNLGLKTSYRQFAESEYWPFDDQCAIYSKLAKYLQNCRSFDAWFDLERHLAKYAQPSHTNEDANRLLFSAPKVDKKYFSMLQSALCEYIEHAEKSQIDESSLAAKLLVFLSASKGIDNIYSFNYTDLGAFCQKLNVNRLPYYHVHGCCKAKSTILGISDDEKVLDGYDFLYKTSNSYYQSTNVRYALQRSSLVIFFGHSLGPQDYHYFSDFFRKQSRLDIEEKDAKTILIITYDEASRMNIIRQLRQMNEGRVNLLYDCNQLRIYTVSNTYGDSILADVQAEVERIWKAKEDADLYRFVNIMSKAQ